MTYSYTFEEQDKYRSKLHDLIYCGERNIDWLCDIEAETGYEIEGMYYDDDTDSYYAELVAYENADKILVDEYAEVVEWIGDYIHNESDYEDYCQRERDW